MTDGYSLFQMPGPFRQSLIAGHLFYTEQARVRLLEQFVALEQPQNAQEFVTKYMTENSFRFDPNYHDEGDFYNEACERYQALIRLGMQARLSIVAGMYHEWDKHLRKWLTDEIRHWHSGETVPLKIWAVDFGKLADLMESLGCRVRDQAYFPKLDACRLVVNVYKHGKGSSFNELKKKYPEYLPDPLSKINQAFSGLDYLDYTHLEVSENQLQNFSDAIVAFWKDVPEDIFDHEKIEPPSWFTVAMEKDKQAESSQQGDSEQ